MPGRPTQATVMEADLRPFPWILECSDLNSELLVLGAPVAEFSVVGNGHDTNSGGWLSDLRTPARLLGVFTNHRAVVRNLPEGEILPGIPVF